MTHLILLFLHVTAAMGIVAGLGIEGLTLVHLRAARNGADVRQSLTSSRYAQRIAGSSLLVAIITGLYLATVYWHWSGAWMGVAMLTIIAMALVGGLMTGRALRSVTDAMGPGAIPALQARLGMSYTIRLGLFLGIVFLMTTKPESGPIALAAVAVAGAVGFLAGLPARRRGAVRA